MYLNRPIPAEYPEFYSWMMGKSEFHWLYDNWLNHGTTSWLCPDIQPGSSLSNSKVLHREMYKIPINVPQKSLQANLEPYKTNVNGVEESKPKIKAKRVHKRKIHKGYLIDKPMNQYDKKTGLLVREYDSGAHIESVTGFKGKGVVEVCTGRRATAYGYKWKFAK